MVEDTKNRVDRTNALDASQEAMSASSWYNRSRDHESDNVASLHFFFF